MLKCHDLASKGKNEVPRNPNHTASHRKKLFYSLDRPASKVEMLLTTPTSLQASWFLQVERSASQDYTLCVCVFMGFLVVLSPFIICVYGVSCALSAKAKILASLVSTQMWWGQEQSIKPAHLSPSRKVREGLADVLSMHEMLTNQILLFHFATVATPWLRYSCIYTSCMSPALSGNSAL